MLARAGLVVAIAAALAGSVAAKTNSDTAINCPSSAATTERIEALGNQVEALAARLEQLDDMLDQLSDQRRDALDQAKSRIEDVVHDDSLSQADIDREVARALAQAQARGEQTARSAQQLHKAMAEVRSRIDVLHQQMRALAARDPHKNADAG
jgi:chromosome segregation ATPase